MKVDLRRRSSKNPLSQRAVAKHEDAFTLNTLGTVLMRRAAEPRTNNSSRHAYVARGFFSLG
jgi:hypothetical protein